MDHGSLASPCMGHASVCMHEYAYGLSANANPRRTLKFSQLWQGQTPSGMAGLTPRHRVGVCLRQWDATLPSRHDEGRWERTYSRHPCGSRSRRCRRRVPVAGRSRADRGRSQHHTPLRGKLRRGGHGLGGGTGANSSTPATCTAGTDLDALGASCVHRSAGRAASHNPSVQLL